MQIQFLQTIIEFYTTLPIDGAFFAILQNKLNDNDSKLLQREQKPVGLRKKIISEGTEVGKKPCLD